MSKQVVILAAGMGTRLARPLPKPLTELRDGRSIMKQQIDNLGLAFGESYRVMIVVGFKLEAIIERFPEATFVTTSFTTRPTPQRACSRHFVHLATGECCG
jgi:choline kinase